MAWILLGIMSILENNYFGGNWMPKSDAEMVCDLIIMGVAAIVATR